MGRLALLVSFLVSFGLAGNAAAQTIAIENATVIAGPGRKLEGATVVLRNGSIAAVGTGVKAPAGAEVIDGTGKWVTAGLVDSMTQLGLVEVGAEASTVDGRFGFQASPDDDGVHAAFSALDAFNPSSVAIPVTRTGGVTTAVTAPVGGLLSGSSAYVSLAEAISPADVTLDAKVAYYAYLGQQGSGHGGGSRGMALERLREVLSDAQLYGRNRAAYDRNASRKLSAARADLEALQDVLRRRVPLVLAAHRASDILAGLRLANDFNLRIVIAGGVEAWRVAPQLAAARVGVILDPSNNLPSSFDEAYVRDDNARILADAGVPVAISPIGEAHNVRLLRQLAGIGVAFGLTWDQALAAVTTVPVQLFGLGKRGELKNGAVADVVVWSGDPFEVSTLPERVFIGGKEQSLENRQTKLFQRYRTLPKR